MTFLAGGWLFGALALVAVPTLIHLLTRRPPRPQAFPPLPLLRNALRRQARRIRLRRFLLLLLRTLAVAAAVSAALLPVFGGHSADPSGDRSPVTLVIDASGSMAARGDDGVTFWQRAVTAAVGAAGRRPVGLVVCTTEGPQAVLSAPRSAPPVASLLADFQPAGSVDLGACSASVTGQTLLLSDGWATVPSGGGVRLLAAEGERENWGLGRVGAQVFPGGQVRFDATLLGAPGRRAVTLLKDGEVLTRVHAQIPKERSRAAVAMTVRLEPGAHRLSISLADDRLLSDNRRELLLRLAGPTRVLAINGDARAVGYRDELFYVGQAARALGQHDPFVLQSVALGEEVNAPLQEAAVVVLANVSRLDTGFASALRDFVQRGGGLLVSGGDRVDPGALNSALGELLPARLRSRWQALGPDGRPARGAALNVRPPETVSDLFGRIGLAGGAGLLRTQVWQGLNLHPGGRVEWRLADGRPLLVSGDRGRGRVALLTAALDRDGTDLAIRPGFVPFLRGVLRELAGTSASGLAPQLAAGQSVERHLGGDSVTVVGPQGSVRKIALRGGVLRFTPPGDGLWVVEGQPVAWTRHEDPRESVAVAVQPQARSASGAEGVGGGTVLWPFLLLLAVVCVVLEAWVTASDARQRSAAQKTS
jgi:hypothetical protein